MVNIMRWEVSIITECGVILLHYKADYSLEYIINYSPNNQW